MARNLLNAGHKVRFDIARVEIEGLSVMSSATDAASEVDVLITMLPDGDALKNIRNRFSGIWKFSFWIVQRWMFSARMAAAKSRPMLSHWMHRSRGVGGARAGTDFYGGWH